LAILTTLKAGFVFSGEGGPRRRHRTDTARLERSVGDRHRRRRVRIPGRCEGERDRPRSHTPAAVDAFSHGANVKLGGDVSVAAGPVDATPPRP